MNVYLHHHRLNPEVMNILVEEDEEDIASLYKIALEKSNHSVTIIHDGQECLNVYSYVFSLFRDTCSFDIASYSISESLQ